ncbi:hypothetical protein F442_19337, partial [Phytophthora nicotianae P10297]
RSEGGRLLSHLSKSSICQAMRHQVAVLVAVALLVATSTATGSNIMTDTLSFERRLDIPTKTNSRSHETLEDTAEDEQEGRGVLPTTVESVAASLKITTEQLQSWLKGGSKSTDDVFKALTLDSAADAAIANPQLQTWIGYMKLFNKENPKQQTSLVTTLASHFKYHDLAKAIEAAKAVPQTVKFAKRLEFELIQRWLAQEKNPDEIFQLLKLDIMRYDLFEKPELFTWVKYMDDFNEMYPEKKTSLFARLSWLIPDESALVDMLIKAKSIASTEKLALRVQEEQTKFWLQNGKTPEDLFTLLRLDKADGSLLENPIFDAWIKYADDFREMYPKISLDPIATIDDYYSIPKVATMIVEATVSPSTSKIAYRLNTEQYRDWLNRFHPAEVFMKLELDRAGKNLFRSPLLVTWLKYVSFYSKKRGKVSATSLLKQRFGKQQLDKMLQEAQKVPATEKIASGLLNSLHHRSAK